MSGNSAKNKRQEEKYVQMIRELASLPMNKQCFDCNSKGPTYVE
jgi:Arf-GAP domain and FG repeat-containing protein 1